MSLPVPTTYVVAIIIITIALKSPRGGALDFVQQTHCRCGCALEVTSISSGVNTSRLQPCDNNVSICVCTDIQFIGILTGGLSDNTA